jgi:hypothetical protein
MRHKQYEKTNKHRHKGRNLQFMVFTFMIFVTHMYMLYVVIIKIIFDYAECFILILATDMTQSAGNNSVSMMGWLTFKLAADTGCVNTGGSVYVVIGILTRVMKRIP